MGNQKQIRKRHFILDHCLRDTLHEYTLEDMLKIVNNSLAELGQRPVSERQLYNDISFFQNEEGYGAELDTYRIVRVDEKGRNRSYVAYRYANPDFSIQDLNLPELQLRFFRAVVGGLLNFGSTPMQQWLSNHYEKLFEYTDGLGVDDCVLMDNNPYVGGAKAQEWVLNFEKIFMATVDRHALDLRVSTFYYGTVQGCFHPFLIKQYNRRWYVLGVLDDNREKVLTVPIDLVLSVDFAPEPYYKYPFKPMEYFDDIVGVYNDPDKPVLDVHLRFHSWLAKHLEFNPLHGSQRSHWVTQDGAQVLDVHLSVKQNQELENMLMSYSGLIEVLGPKEVVDSYREHLKMACLLNGLKVD